jgi:putative photosynthetic complex assembly protein
MDHAEHHDAFQVPKGALIGIAALVFLTVAGAATVSLTGVGASRMTPPKVVASLDLKFADAADGSVLVYDARDGKLIESLSPGNGGFVRVVLRSLARERMLASIGKEPPFHLARHENGQLTLTDKTTNKQIDLNAFGSSNLDAFARLMTKGSSAQ